MSLAAAPHCQPAILAPQRGGVLGLDVALVHRPGTELALDDDIRIRESLFDVAEPVLYVARRIRPGTTLVAEAFRRGDMLVEDGRVWLQRVLDVGDRWEHVVADVDQTQGLLGGVGAGCGHSGDRRVPCTAPCPRRLRCCSGTSGS